MKTNNNKQDIKNNMRVYTTLAIAFFFGMLLGFMLMWALRTLIWGL